MKLLILLLLSVAACDKPAPPPPVETPPPSPSPATNNQTIPSQAKADAGTPSRAEIQAHMREHWGLAVVIRDAVIAAELDELPYVASELADHETPPSLAARTKETAAMRSAAKMAQNAKSLNAAAKATAQLARACGDCHTASNTVPAIPSEPLPPDEDATKAHMLRHDAAARELWAGLVIPSDERWANGVKGLAEPPLKKGDFFEDWEVTDALLKLDGNVHSMRKRIAAASTRDERTKLFGELISNCASCHAATATGPVD